ncbi:MAG: hypothetical protein ACYS19_16730 [Planctomycetota bacterium]
MIQTNSFAVWQLHWVGPYHSGKVAVAGPGGAEKNKHALANQESLIGESDDAL